MLLIISSMYNNIYHINSIILLTHLIPCLIYVIGLAIKATEFDDWRAGPNCTPAPYNCMYCPLCLASVEDSDMAWLNHLTTGCPRNTRTNGS